MENIIEMVMHQTESKFTAEQVAGQVEAACNKYSLDGMRCSERHCERNEM